MDNHLLEYIEIKDFKCFKDFHAEGFKRVNLIGGKNNVGKTAFMEACYVNVHSQDIKSCLFSLISLKRMRNLLNLLLDKEFSFVELLESNSNIFTESQKNLVTFYKKEENGIKEYIFKFKGENIEVNANQFSSEAVSIQNIKFIDNFGYSNEELKEVYIAVQKKDKEEILYKYINEFDDNIDKFKIMGGETPECKVIDRDEYQDINEFGDGLKHYISIICSLYACENGYLFIDEIDNGIHYTQLDRLWEIILRISEEQNVQVFATTHSKECIESFNRVQLKLEDEDTSYFEMIKNINTNNLYMRNLDSKQLKYELTHNGEFRG